MDKVLVRLSEDTHILLICFRIVEFVVMWRKEDVTIMRPLLVDVPNVEMRVKELNWFLANVVCSFSIF